MPRRRSPTPPKPVALITLPEGTTFEIPGTGRKGLVLRTPSTSSAYCRLWFSADELAQLAEQAATAPKKGKRKPYEDKTISSSTLVRPTSTPSPSSTPRTTPCSSTVQ